jgi:zona occludens toxin (predicted ATPase)
MGDFWILPKVVSLIAIILLLLWLFFFMFGGLPLVFLKYDAALDAHFVRGFYDVHYLGLIAVALTGAVSSAVSDRTAFAAATLCMGLIGIAARRVIVVGMDRLRDAVTAADTLAIQGFRKLHVWALLLNAALLCGFVAVVAVASGTLQNM